MRKWRHPSKEEKQIWIEQHRPTFTESIASSPKWPHIEESSALWLQGSYYHVINLFRINRAAKRHRRSRRLVLRQPLQHGGWPITPKATLISTCLSPSIFLIHTVKPSSCGSHPSVLNFNSMQGQLPYYGENKIKKLYSIRKKGSLKI